MAKGRRGASRGLLAYAILVAALLAYTVAAGTGCKAALQGSGSSFLYPQLEAWIQAFQEEHPDIVINYNPTGSGTGQNQFLQRVVDFAGSDPPLKRSDWERLQGRVIQLPVILGAVAIVYNMPGLEGHLNLSGEVLAKIYLGKIRYWDDPEIVKLNPNARLPHEEIIAVHRSDSSGTTNVFTLFLHKAAPDIWPESMVGKSIEWPVDSTGRGVGGKGNQGVAEQVRQNPYSIGYVEYNYALKVGLQYAWIVNREGVPVPPSPETVQAAAKAAVGKLPRDPRDDWSGAFDAIVYAPGRDSYPITSFSFLILWTHYSDPGKARGLSVFLQWIATEGYNHVVEGYVPVPGEIREMILEAARIIGGGQ